MKKLICNTLSKLKNLVASNSLPTYGSDHKDKSKYTKNYFIWNFNGGQTIIGIATDAANAALPKDHNFSGDAITTHHKNI